MPWGYAAGAIAGVAADSLKSDKNGGAGTKNSSSEPWAPAQPWILNNLVQGQALQGQYLANPFNARQTAAMDNQYALSDYGRELVPSLLGQISGQPIGFDAKNPDRRPNAYQFNAGGSGGLGQRSVLNAQPPAQPAEEAPKKEDELVNPFMQQESAYGAGQGGGVMFDTYKQIRPDMKPGGYGEFEYGSPVKPGSKAERDMQLFFAMGGADPWGMYGRGPAPVQT